MRKLVEKTQELSISKIPGVKWVTIQKLSELTGYTTDAIAKKIERGQWPEGLMWLKSPDNRRQINLEAYNQWVEGQLRVV